nr:immunoglobulin light chain junction region [Macaca mulatta]MPN65818.1 immunoglobulin light chain junction region [Macaca mulatta]MPN65906.1 immunoglobulin light chain junction region [Macaca mulatta]MPN66116.1 immunoglobulin light chain junction region [Macaca mulatta]MPN66226.1 immunoglobulin light chain junction region [Macaca mulatta]
CLSYDSSLSARLF